jgi:hypothetical protein
MNPEAGVASGSCPICVANAVSDSWEEDTDLIAGPLEQKSFDQVLTLAAATGISFQFSTGDDGDAGLDTPVGAAGVPSNSPHATAVGGTSILNKVGASGTETVGWGSNITNLINGNVLDPPVPTGFYGGGGGGESVFFAKPSWQKALPGTGRQPLTSPPSAIPSPVSPSSSPRMGNRPYRQDGAAPAFPVRSSPPSGLSPTRRRVSLSDSPELPLPSSQAVSRMCCHTPVQPTSPAWSSTKPVQPTTRQPHSLTTSSSATPTSSAPSGMKAVARTSISASPSIVRSS